MSQPGYLSLSCFGRCSNSAAKHIHLNILNSPICMTSEELLITLCLYFLIYYTYTCAEGAAVLMNTVFCFAVHKHLMCTKCYQVKCQGRTMILRAIMWSVLCTRRKLVKYISCKVRIVCWYLLLKWLPTWMTNDQHCYSSETQQISRWSRISSSTIFCCTLRRKHKDCPPCACCYLASWV